MSDVHSRQHQRHRIDLQKLTSRRCMVWNALLLLFLRYSFPVFFDPKAPGVMAVSRHSVNASPFHTFTNHLDKEVGGEIKRMQNDVQNGIKRVSASFRQEDDNIIRKDKAEAKKKVKLNLNKLEIVYRAIAEAEESSSKWTTRKDSFAANDMANMVISPLSDFLLVEKENLAEVYPDLKKLGHIMNPASNDYKQTFGAMAFGCILGGKESVAKAAGEASLAKAAEEASLAKAAEEASLAKAAEEASLAKAADETSLAKTAEGASVAKAAEKTSLAKAAEEASLARTTREASLENAAAKASLAKTAREASLPISFVENIANEKSFPIERQQDFYNIGRDSQQQMLQTLRRNHNFFSGLSQKIVTGLLRGKQEIADAFDNEENLFINTLTTLEKELRESLHREESHLMFDVKTAVLLFVKTAVHKVASFLWKLKPIFVELYPYLKQLLPEKIGQEEIQVQLIFMSFYGGPSVMRKISLAVQKAMKPEQSIIRLQRKGKTESRQKEGGEISSHKKYPMSMVSLAPKLSGRNMKSSIRDYSTENTGQKSSAHAATKHAIGDLRQGVGSGSNSAAEDPITRNVDEVKTQIGRKLGEDRLQMLEGVEGNILSLSTSINKAIRERMSRYTTGPGGSFPSEMVMQNVIYVATKELSHFLLRNLPKLIQQFPQLQLDLDPKVTAARAFIDVLGRNGLERQFAAFILKEESKFRIVGHMNDQQIRKLIMRTDWIPPTRQLVLIRNQVFTVSTILSKSEEAKPNSLSWIEQKTQRFNLPHQMEEIKRMFDKMKKDTVQGLQQKINESLKDVNSLEKDMEGAIKTNENRLMAILRQGARVVATATQGSSKSFPENLRIVMNAFKQLLQKVAPSFSRKYPLLADTSNTNVIAAFIFTNYLGGGELQHKVVTAILTHTKNNLPLVRSSFLESGIKAMEMPHAAADYHNDEVDSWDEETESIRSSLASPRFMQVGAQKGVAPVTAVLPVIKPMGKLLLKTIFAKLSIGFTKWSKHLSCDFSELTNHFPQLRFFMKKQYQVLFCFVVKYGAEPALKQLCLKTTEIDKKAARDSFFKQILKLLENAESHYKVRLTVKKNDLELRNVYLFTMVYGNDQLLNNVISYLETLKKHMNNLENRDASMIMPKKQKKSGIFSSMMSMFKKKICEKAQFPENIIKNAIIQERERVKLILCFVAAFGLEDALRLTCKAITTSAISNTVVQGDTQPLPDAVSLPGDSEKVSMGQMKNEFNEMFIPIMKLSFPKVFPEPLSAPTDVAAVLSFVLFYRGYELLDEVLPYFEQIRDIQKDGRTQSQIPAKHPLKPRNNKRSYKNFQRGRRY